VVHVQTSDPDGSLTRGPEIGYEIGFLLRRAHERAARAFSAALAPLNIEGRHFALLNQLERPRSQRELVDLIGSDKASMVRLVDHLEAQGLVARRPSPGNRRIHAVTLTEAGAVTLAQARRAAAQVSTQLLERLPKPARTQLVGLLNDFLDEPLL
jgi:MarR family transcriptional regulator, lower aerobic nicotinate degradation pathway regulator